MEVRSPHQVLEVVKSEYCLALDEGFNELEVLFELETGCNLSKMVSMVLAEIPYSTLRAQGWASLAYDVYSKSNTDNVVSFMSSVMAPVAHGDIFCSSLVFFQWKKSFRALMETEQNLKVDPEGEKRELCKCLKSKAMLRSTREAQGCTAAIPAVKISSTRLRWKRPFIFGGKV